MKKTITLIIAAVILIIAISIIYWPSPPNTNLINLADESDESDKITDTEPIFEITYTNTSANEIIVDSPVAGNQIASPLTITGEARGTWFFEASAPVILVDWDGLIIAQGYIMTVDDWMTEDFVNFEGQLIFTSPILYNSGVLIIKNDNPSGLSENDKTIEIPIMF